PPEELTYSFKPPPGESLSETLLSQQVTSKPCSSRPDRHEPCTFPRAIKSNWKGFLSCLRLPWSARPTPPSVPTRAVPPGSALVRRTSAGRPPNDCFTKRLTFAT